MGFALLGLHIRSRNVVGSSIELDSDFYDNKEMFESKGYYVDYNVFNKCTGVRVLDLKFLSVFDLNIEDALAYDINGLGINF